MTWLRNVLISRALPYVVVAVGALVLGLAAWGGRVEYLRAGWKAEAVRWHTAYDTLVVDTKAKAELAELYWKSKVKEKDDEYAKKASISDGRYAALREQYSAAVLRAKAARGGASRPAAAAQGDRPGVPEVAADAPQLCISDEDAMRVADLAAYATSCHEWAVSLETPETN